MRQIPEAVSAEERNAIAQSRAGFAGGLHRDRRNLHLRSRRVAAPGGAQDNNDRTGELARERAATVPTQVHSSDR